MPLFLPDACYSDTRLSTARKESAVSGERDLWKRVVYQIIHDTKGTAADVSGEKERKRIQRKAIRWFVEDGEDFRHVCFMAGYAPEWVREKVMAFLKEGKLIP